MAAALQEYAIYHRSAHSPSEIDTGDRAAGPSAGPARLKRDCENRPAEFLLQSRCHQTDHAGMPAFRSGYNHAALVFESERRKRLGFRLRFSRLLDHPTLGVEPVELCSNARRFGYIALKQKTDAQIGAPDPSPRID